MDDDLNAVHSMALIIKSLGHECQFAIRGLAALDIARSFRPDVILLDMLLPDSRGDEIARRLKQSSELGKARIIAISGAGDELRERALAAGCDDFHRKPLDPVVLEALLAKPDSC